jgi:2',3'-cyclic-nucleotide 2'-phosphodiesterase (5'-nucleotidase family)
MLRILHTNDFHGALDDSRQQELATLRAGVDLYFDCGDCIKAGNLAIPLKPDPVWSRLAALTCTASVPGNRESHPLEAPFRSKIAGATHPILCANLKRKDNGAQVLSSSMLIEVGGLKVGVIAVMVPMVTARMASRHASAFLWDDPIQTAVRLAKETRAHVDCLIALTHIGFKKDVELASKCPDIDIIFGGHSHTVLEKAEVVGKTAICQAGSHGHFAGLCDWSSESGTSYRIVSLQSGG